MRENTARPQTPLDKLEEFESLPAKERSQSIADANEYLRANGVKNLNDFDGLMRTK